MFDWDIDALIDTFGERRSPEQNLFFGVVLQAFEDLRPSAWRAPSLRRSAMEWLLEDSRTFPAICDLADVDAAFIRRIAARYVAHIESGGSPKRIILAGDE